MYLLGGLLIRRGNGFYRFIDFLDKIIADTLMCLHLIPRTAIRCPQLLNDSNQIIHVIILFELKFH